jgi:branched-chain amino acid transport system substrate-binding protein
LPPIEILDPQNIGEVDMSKLPPILFVFAGLGLLGGWQWITHSSSSANNTGLLVSGERSLSQTGLSPAKNSAINSFVNKDWNGAIEKFSQSLQSQPNDPESAIYRQNALIAQQEMIAIIAVVPISSNPNVANEILRGVAMGQIEINQNGGIGGKKLKVYISDDANDAEKAISIAKVVATKTDILAVVGSNASGPSLAAAKIYQQAGVVMISPTASTTELSNFGNYIFRTVPPAAVNAHKLAEYSFKVAKKTKVAICVDETSPDNASFSNSYRSEFLALGGSIISTNCKLGQSSFNASDTMSTIVQSGADSILIAPHIERLPQATDLIRANRQRLTLFATPSMNTNITLELGGKEVVGMALPALWHPDLPEAQRFAGQMEKLWGGKVNWRSAMAYDAVVAIGAGGKGCVNQENISAAHTCLATQLRSPSFGIVGAGQSLRFNGKGDRDMEAIMLKVAGSGVNRAFQLQISQAPVAIKKEIK